MAASSQATIPTLYTSGLLKMKTQSPMDQTESVKLDNLVSTESQTLLQIRSVFPFDLFPTIVTVDRTKITITYHLSFFTSQAQSVLIKDIMTIIVQESFLLSGVEIISRIVQQDHIFIPNLSKPDAAKFRQLVEGLMVADKKGVDVSKVSNKELRPKLGLIGGSAQD